MAPFLRSKLADLASTFLRCNILLHLSHPCFWSSCARSALNYEGNSALLLASHSGHGQVVALLLGSGADAEIANKMGSTPLLVAAYGGHTECVRALIGAGAQVMKADGQGRTALHAACHKGRIEVVRSLLDAVDAVADRPDQRGVTPLAAACYAGQARCVELLLQSATVSLESMDANGRTPLEAACHAKRPECVATLLRSFDWSREAAWRPAAAWAEANAADPQHRPCVELIHAAVAKVTAAREAISAPAPALPPNLAAEAASAGARRTWRVAMVPTGC